MTNTPKVVVFSRLFWPEGSGGELATYLIIKLILSKYFNTVVVSGTNNPQQEVFKYCKYIHWSSLKLKYKPLEWAKLFTNKHVIRKLIKKASAVYIPSHSLLPLSIVIKKINPSIEVIVHLHNYQPLTYTSVVLHSEPPSLKTDIIVELYENRSLIRALACGALRYSNLLNILALKYADLVLCVSKKQAEIIAKYVDFIKKKVVVVYNPPPPVCYRKKELSDNPLLLYLGGGSFIKGFHILFKTLPGIIKIMYKENATLAITYGRNVYKNHEKWLMKISKHSKGTIKILKRVPYQELIELYGRAKASIFPSIYEEPLPYAIIESCLSMTIPIASRVGGVPELLRDSKAYRFIFSPLDSESFQEKIKTVITMSADEVIDIGLDMKEKVQRKINNALNKMEELLHETIA